MFTGLIETIGTIKTVKRGDKSISLGIVPGLSDFEIAIGGSLAVNGICLTVVSKSGNELFCTAVYETIRRTELDNVKSRDKVNLERALRLSDRLDGHIVAGHVDGVGKIISDKRIGDGLLREIWVPEDLRVFMAPKGSVTIDGISLTIADAIDDTIIVSLIPHSVSETTMAIKGVGNKVNIECDLFARYIFRMLNFGVTANNSIVKSDNIKKTNKDLLSILEKNGF